MPDAKEARCRVCLGPLSRDQHADCVMFKPGDVDERPLQTPTPLIGPLPTPVGACQSCGHTDHGEDECGTVISEEAGIYTICGCRKSPVEPTPVEALPEWRRVGEVGPGEVHWRNDSRDLDAVVPAAVERAISRDAEERARRLVDELDSIARNEIANREAAEERATQQAEGQREALETALAKRPDSEWFHRQVDRLTENGEAPTPLGWFVTGYEHGRLHIESALSPLTEAPSEEPVEPTPVEALPEWRRGAEHDMRGWAMVTYERHNADGSVDFEDVRVEVERAIARDAEERARAEAEATADEHCGCEGFTTCRWCLHPLKAHAHRWCSMCHEELRLRRPRWKVNAPAADHLFGCPHGEPICDLDGGESDTSYIQRLRVQGRASQSRLEALEEVALRASDRLERLMKYRLVGFNDYDPAPDRDLVARLRELVPPRAHEATDA